MGDGLKNLSGACIAALATCITGCSYFDSKLVAACEESLKDRLRSPATYNRVRVEEFSEEMAIGDWIVDQNRRSPGGSDPIDTIAKLMLEKSQKPMRFIAFITSDASNS
nr:hypothetical protein RAR13_04340 [Aminobacter aminovorans]